MVQVMVQRTIELEIIHHAGDLFSLTVDGVVYAQSREKSHLRNLADKVKQLNEDVDFNVVN